MLTFDVTAKPMTGTFKFRRARAALERSTTIAVLVAATATALLGGCAPPRAPAANAARVQDGSDPNCPSMQARFLTCGNGVRLVTYDERIAMDKYCAPIADIEKSVKGFDRARPMQSLSDGTRAMISGAAGWLLLPKEASIVEAPMAISVWWRDRNCTFPTSLRTSAPAPAGGR